MRRHEVNGFHGSKCDHMRVTPRIALYADRLNRQKYCKRLAHFVVQIMAAQLFDVNRVRAAQAIDVFLSDFAQDTNAEARTGERVSIDEGTRQT